MKHLLLLCALLASGCASMHFGKEEPCGAAQRPGNLVRLPGDDILRVVSWNLHGTHEVAPMAGRIRRIAEQILDRQPDLVLLQEVWFRGDADLLEHALDKDYKRVPDPDAHAVRRHLLAPFGFRGGGLLAFVAKAKPWKHEGGSEFEQFIHGAPWFRFDEGDGVSSKGIQHFSITHERSGLKLAVLNTHLQSPYSEHERLYPEIRASQIVQLSTLAKQVEKLYGAALVLAAGDFNTSPDEEDLYAALTAFWTDLTQKYRDDCKCGTPLNKPNDCKCGTHLDKPKSGPVREGGWIDYVLLRAPAGPSAHPKGTALERITSDSIDCPYSDHHGLDVVVPLSRP